MNVRTFPVVLRCNTDMTTCSEFRCLELLLCELLGT